MFKGDKVNLIGHDLLHALKSTVVVVGNKNLPLFSSRTPFRAKSIGSFGFIQSITHLSQLDKWSKHKSLAWNGVLIEASSKRRFPIRGSNAMMA